ncbi:T9SS type A sorting domain-containing protein [Labilibacter sediminis]|nr:T9SS type A sorting domain-containing protein [Labilibacter sediminis]
MKHSLGFIVLVLFALSIQANSQNKPNVIVIMADDLGYGDVGFNGSIEIPTPNIDRIADNGVKFTSGYTTYSVCGPSRAGFITGRYQQRFGFERNPLYRVDDPHMGLPFDEMTIAESVSQVGYKSGIIGKWHLGAHLSNHPLNRGFDEFYGHLGGGHNYFPEDLTIEDSYAATDESQSYLTWILRNHTPVETDEYITDEFSKEAVEFVTRHKDNPFFLFLSYNAPHTPMQAKAEDLALFPHLQDETGYKRKSYAAMVHAVDRGVGRVLDKLQELNIEDNTIVFFLSDNGGPETKNASDNGVLRGKKSDVYEGGYRVPFAMQWKNNITSGLVYNYPVSSLDIFATLSALSGSPTHPDKPLDGINLIPYLKGENTNQPHETIFLRKIDQDRHAVRYGNFKVIHFKDGTNKKLYDLSTNISENDADGNNLYWNADYRSNRDQLEAIMQQWEAGLQYPGFLGLMHDDLVWANELTLSANNLMVNVNDTEQLSATILPLDAFNDVVLWSSNNTTVASVDQTGLVTAHSDGYALITAKVIDRQQVYKQCVVKVGNPSVSTGITLSKEAINVIAGETAHLSAVVSSNSDNSYAVEWSSNNPSVATINEYGFIITHSDGSAIITATVMGSSGVSATCTINSYPYGTVTSILNNRVKQPEWFSLYPNPASNGVLEVIFNENVANAKACIYNSAGYKVLEATPHNTCRYTFDVSALHNGMYFINVSMNKKVQTKKVMIRN